MAPATATSAAGHLAQEPARRARESAARRAGAASVSALIDSAAGWTVGQLVRQRTDVVDDGALRGAAEHDVQLGDGDGDADAGEHAVHDRGADGERGAGHAQAAQAELGESGEDGDGAGRAPSVAVDQVGGDDREPGGGPAHLERGAAEPAGDESADGGGDESRLERGAGGEGDAEGQRQGDQEDGDRGGQIGAGDAESAGRIRRRGCAGWWMRFGRGSAESAARVGTQADMVPVSSGAARSRNRWSPPGRRGGSRPWVTACSGGMSQRSVNGS